MRYRPGIENEIESLIEIAKKAAIMGGKAILDVYEKSDFSISSKEDSSPLTLADLAAHSIISESLKATQYPLLSEEGKKISFAERTKWETYWLVDPLDGTKEFINRNGEFTVNIALIKKGKVVFGVVFIPVTKQLFWGGAGLGAFKQEGTKAPVSIHVKSGDETPIAIVASRSHLNVETQAFIDTYPGCILTSVGSSLKFLLVAEGSAHYYPRYGPTMEWDTAAAQGVVEGAGGSVINPENNKALFYNKENLLNPFFLVSFLKNN